MSDETTPRTGTCPRCGASPWPDFIACRGCGHREHSDGTGAEVVAPVRPLMGVPPSGRYEVGVDVVHGLAGGPMAHEHTIIGTSDEPPRKGESVAEYHARVSGQMDASFVAAAGRVVREAARKRGMDADWVARLEVLCGLKETP